MKKNKNLTSNNFSNLNRRKLIKGGFVIAMATSLWWPNKAEAANVFSGREVSFLNAHTGEKFKGEYWQKGRYLPDAFKEIKHIMRDHRTGEIFPIDPRLVDILFVLKKKFNTNNHYRIFSGYRSPATNKMLRRSSFGVARKSLHMQGQAVDLRLPGYSLSALRRQAMALRAGGVGYYPKSQFVHLDTGRVRHW